MDICVYKKGLFNNNHDMFISLKTSDETPLIEPGYKARLKLRYKIKHMFNLILYGKNITEAVVTFDTSRTFTNEQRTMRVKVERLWTVSFMIPILIY